MVTKEWGTSKVELEAIRFLIARNDEVGIAARAFIRSAINFKGDNIEHLFKDPYSKVLHCNSDVRGINYIMTRIRSLFNTQVGYNWLGYLASAGVEQGLLPYLKGEFIYTPCIEVTSDTLLTIQTRVTKFKTVYELSYKKLTEEQAEELRLQGRI